MSISQLSSTSYLVLGLIAREGASTPYDLKRHVAATIGNFWSFPHALLYKEPPRLVELGLLTEEREESGRRRRLFSITLAGAEALEAWLERPSWEATELRDPGLLQLFFADQGSSDAQGDIAREQLPMHRTKLASYEAEDQLEQGSEGMSAEDLTVKHWRGQTLRMGVLYERAAVEFWEGVAADVAAGLAQATGDGGAIASSAPGEGIVGRTWRAVSARV